MWIFTKGSFLALVKDLGDPSKILVRARCAEDIQRLFPEALIVHKASWGYPYHASIPRDTVALGMSDQVRELDYPDFVARVPEQGRRRAYQAVSAQMSQWPDTNVEGGGAEATGGFGPLEHAAYPPRHAWGPLKAAVATLVGLLDTWEGKTPDDRQEAAWALGQGLYDLGFVPDGIHYMLLPDPLPERKEIDGLNLDQSLRLLGRLQRIAKWVYHEKGMGHFLESGLANALIRHIERLVHQIEGA